MWFLVYHNYVFEHEHDHDHDHELEYEHIYIGLVKKTEMKLLLAPIF